MYLLLVSSDVSPVSLKRQRGALWEQPVSKAIGHRVRDIYLVLVFSIFRGHGSLHSECVP